MEIRSLTKCYRDEDCRVAIQVYFRTLDQNADAPFRGFTAGFVKLALRDHWRGCVTVGATGVVCSARLSGSIPQHEERSFGRGVQGRRARTEEAIWSETIQSSLRLQPWQSRQLSLQQYQL